MIIEKKRLSLLIQATELRIKSWGELLKEHSQLKEKPEGWAEWKDELRDYLNEDKKSLKHLSLEATHFNQGLNPPYFYKH